MLKQPPFRRPRGCGARPPRPPVARLGVPLLSPRGDSPARHPPSKLPCAPGSLGQRVFSEASLAPPPLAGQEVLLLFSTQR